ncbi:MAG: hypothetical protein Q4E11_09800 [Corynebacterium sp.]|uniref:hypothetical protein n=1 Tax=Corynebacterium sp. TaxID=1720 RepID=UPI0026DAFD48|nr:hypothetical protein [Corynebacterium sp.]MDO5030853.1 hypothetical protein [Corynebacterium sp.]
MSSSRSTHLIATASIAGTLLLALTGCSSDNPDKADTTSQPAQSSQQQEQVPSQQTSSSESAPAPEDTADVPADGENISLDTAALEKVDAQQFGPEGMGMFFADLGGAKTECFYNGISVSCFGTPDASVPDVEVPPFPKQAPGAISLGEAGATYTLSEGVPPAQEELADGQWVELGPVQCGKPNPDQLVCQSANAAFAIEGKEKNIRTTGTVLDSEQVAGADAGEPGAPGEPGAQE